MIDFQGRKMKKQGPFLICSTLLKQEQNEVQTIINCKDPSIALWSSQVNEELKYTNSEKVL